MDALSPQHATRRWHRRVAWVALFAACTFALTGVLHPLMSRFQPKPAQFLPPPMPQLAEPLPAPAALLSDMHALAGLRLLQGGDQLLWRVRGVDDVVRYVDARTGVPLPDAAERAHAERLARWYAGEASAAVAELERITAFSADYSYVSRLLPVWRVRFARPDALELYVSTEDDRLATISDQRKRVFQRTFQAVHSWGWLPAPLRNGWINLLLAGVAFTVLAGLTLALKTPGGRRWNLRRVHRWGGVVVALAVLAWAVSGFVQALGNAERERADAPQRPLHIPSSSLQAAVTAMADGFSSLTLASLDGRPVWRFSLVPPQTTTGRGAAMSEHHAQGTPQQGASTPSAARYVSAQDGQVINDGERQHLAELLAHFGVQAPAQSATAVLKFSEEYGFLFKRLPVWRVQEADDDHTAVYIDTGGERLAARVGDGDRAVGTLFAYAHKWEWLTPLAGKDVRDVITSVLALLLVAVAIGGTLLRRKG